MACDVDVPNVNGDIRKKRRNARATPTADGAQKLLIDGHAGDCPHYTDRPTPDRRHPHASILIHPEAPGQPESHVASFDT
ncbi:hypothetical protein WQQ_15850 [Hydrocarboniphaga effusa AP103]|uniref:Uncharacterized protein n=1 Tax=Hydrocarboniphaga effusa AP103 TaxID=1172194 RepID=I8TCR4_9GAMM|nr:hypothetical protein WQQ_15850 [Hydrocarboniphaga effusa AP103]